MRALGADLSTSVCNARNWRRSWQPSARRGLRRSWQLSNPGDFWHISDNLSNPRDFQTHIWQRFIPPGPRRSPHGASWSGSLRRTAGSSLVQGMELAAHQDWPVSAMFPCLAFSVFTRGSYHNKAVPSERPGTVERIMSTSGFFFLLLFSWMTYYDRWRLI